MGTIGAEYNRFQWDSQGGWAGVEDYIGFVELWFFDDYDESEDEEGERSDEDLGNRLIITWTATLPYRAYKRVEDGWELMVEEMRVRTDKQVVRLTAEDR